MTRGDGSGGTAAPRQMHPIARPRIEPRRTPFERTIAFQRYGVRVTPEPGAEHHYTKALIVEQGFDGLPHVVSGRELHEYVRAGETELFRGVSAARYAEQLRSGELFVGQGAFGGGIYAAGGADGRAHAADYALDPGAVLVRLSVKAQARVAPADDLTQAMIRARHEARSRPAALIAAIMTADLNIFATYLGYDGVVDPESDIWLIFNRTALRIQDKDIEP